MNEPADGNSGESGCVSPPNTAEKSGGETRGRTDSKARKAWTGAEVILRLRRGLLSAVQVRPDLVIKILPRIRRRHGNPNFAGGDANLRADFQQPGANGGHLGLFQVGGFEPQSPQSAHQDI